MNKTLSWFTEYISTSLVKDSFDPVGLMLSVRIVEFFQDMMINRRKIPVLDVCPTHHPLLNPVIL